MFEFVSRRLVMSLGLRWLFTQLFLKSRFLVPFRTLLPPIFWPGHVLVPFFDVVCSQLFVSGRVLYLVHGYFSTVQVVPWNHNTMAQVAK